MEVPAAAGQRDVACLGAWRRSIVDGHQVDAARVVRRSDSNVAQIMSGSLYTAQPTVNTFIRFEPLKSNAKRNRTTAIAGHSHIAAERTAA